MRKVLGVLIVLVLVGLLGWQVFRRASMSLKGSPRRHRSTPIAAVGPTVGPGWFCRWHDIRSAPDSSTTRPPLILRRPRGTLDHLTHQVGRTVVAGVVARRGGRCVRGDHGRHVALLLPDGHLQADRALSPYQTHSSWQMPSGAPSHLALSTAESSAHAPIIAPPWRARGPDEHDRTPVTAL